MPHKEEWRPLAPMGYPQYHVSSLGRVSKVLDANGATRIVPISINQKGHRFVPLRTATGKMNQRVVNKLVATSFLKPEDRHIMQSVIHLDGDRGNLRVENLCWRPRWFAPKFFKQFTIPHDFPEDGPIRDTTLDRLYPNVAAVAHKYGVLMENVYTAAEEGHGRVMFTMSRFAWEIT